MQEAKTWNWKVIGAGTIAAGEVDAVDARDALSRALTSTSPVGELVGQMFKVPVTVLDDAPGNFDTFYECVHDNIYIAVRTADTAPARTLAELRALWGVLGDVPVSDAERIEVPFLDFGVGTQREDIWHWFEAQHPRFIVGDVMQGIWPQ